MGGRQTGEATRGLRLKAMLHCGVAALGPIYPKHSDIQGTLNMRGFIKAANTHSAFMVELSSDLLKDFHPSRLNVTFSKENGRVDIIIPDNPQSGYKVSGRATKAYPLGAAMPRLKEMPEFGSTIFEVEISKDRLIFNVGKPVGGVLSKVAQRQYVKHEAAEEKSSLISDIDQVRQIMQQVNLIDREVWRLYVDTNTNKISAKMEMTIE